MDAVAMSPERRRELAELRARAYGPEADIHLDEHAVARLEQLEALVRRSPGSDAPVSSAPSGVSAQSTAPQAPAAVLAPSEPARAEASPSAVAPPPAVAPLAAVAPLGWWRSIPVWAVVSVGAIVAALAFGVPAVLPARADATLSVIADVEPDDVDPPQMLDWFGVELDSLQRHEDFHGLKVWSATDTRGSRCLMFSFREWADGRCAPEPIEPVVDLTIYPGMPAIEGLDLPVGSVVRLALRGGVVDVTVAEAGSDARQISNSWSASEPSRA